MPASKGWKPSTSTCKGCGKSFLTGGRGRPRANARYCSRVCFGSGPTTPRLISELTIAQAAYTAGMLDGEGSIVVWQRKDNPNGNLSLKVVIVNTNYEVMDWLKNNVGGNVNSKPTAYPTNFTKEPKPCWTWVVNGRNAVLLLKQIAPYMIIKREKAEYAIGTQPMG